MSEDVKELPEGWAWSKLVDVANVIYGQSPPSSTYNTDGVGLPFFQGKAEFTDKHPIVQKYCNAPTRFAEPGDILISIRAPVGPTNVANVQCGIGRGLAAIRKSPALTTGYVRKYIRRTESDLARQGTGTTFNAITKRVLNNHPIAIPPLAEQGRIVDKIEELFSAIEAGERAIERARAALSRYRKSILKAAVTGELTRDWREKNEPEETAEALLERILKARFEAWEKAELDKLTSKSKPHPQTDKQWEKFRARYKEPVAPVSDFNFDMPTDWVLVSVESVTSAVRVISYGVLQPGKDTPDGTRLVRVCDIKRGQINQSNLKRIKPNIASKYQRTFLKGGELLVTLVGTVGRTAIVREALIGANVARAVGVLSTNENINTRWLEFCLNEEKSKQNLIGSAREVARKTLNLEQLRSFPFPLPPLTEQTEIVSRVEEALSKADAVEATLEAQAQSARALKQAVLKSAFEGNLVPQDPNDEPASELLKRIKAAS